MCDQAKPVKLCNKCQRPGEFYVRGRRKSLICKLCERANSMINYYAKHGQPVPKEQKEKIPKEVTQRPVKQLPPSDFFRVHDWMSVMVGNEIEFQKHW